MTDIPRLILELAENSLESGADAISITIAETGPGIDASVADDGCGMTGEAIASSLSGGYSTKANADDGNGGRGISVCRMAAESAGGTFLITSGQTGTTASLSIPQGEPITGDLAETAMAISCGRAGVRVTISRSGLHGGYSYVFYTGASASDALRVYSDVRKFEREIRESNKK